MKDSIIRFLKDEDGPTAVEYAVMLAMILVAALAKRDDPDLRPWHRVTLDNEYGTHVEDQVTTLADYLALEERLFAELDEKLIRHVPRDDANREYLVVSATHTVEGDSYGSDGGGGEPYTCQFTVVDAKQPFRAEAVTSRPYVRGPQTAMVVGKDG